MAFSKRAILAILSYALMMSSGFLLSSYALLTEARAQKVYIDIGEAKIKKSLIALPPFQYYGSQTQKSNVQLGQTLYGVVSNDLTVSNLFSFISQDAFLEDTATVGLKPAPGTPNGFDFNKWKAISSEFLIRAGYRVTGTKISLEAYVYYVPQGRLVFGKTYEGPTSAVRKVAHTFANDVVKNLTGKDSMFLTKIVTAVRKQGSKFKEIYVMDWDGADAQKITSHNSVAISPAWSPNGKKIAYTAFAYHPKAKTRNADLFVYELSTGKRWLVSYRKGINSGACFLPGSEEMALTLSQEGSPDIFKMSVDGKNLKRLTRGPNNAMNVEPAISPDGKMVAFSSDRHGSPMLYTMDIHGRDVKRITYAGRYNASPSWSPDGKQIAFAGHDKGHFDIFIVNKDGTGLKRLTSAKRRDGTWSDNEDPSFSPDGRHILFISDRTGKKQLYIVSPDGTNERRVTVDAHEYDKPKWGPNPD